MSSLIPDGLGGPANLLISNGFSLGGSGGVGTPNILIFDGLTGSAGCLVLDGFLGASGVIPIPPDGTCGTDLMRTGLGWLTDMLHAHVSQPIVYMRGTTSVTLCATFGKKLYRLEDEEGGSRLEWTDRDFLIPAANLIIAGNLALPRRGDRVRIRGNPGYVEVYEVSAPGGEAPFEWSDPYRKMLRVHGKHIATEVGS